MSTGRIDIVEAAASADIRNIQNAIQDLDESRRTVMQLKANAETMHGRTGAAIVNKSNSMIKRIDGMINQLNATIAVIKKTVQWYQEKDSEVVIKG